MAIFRRTRIRRVTSSAVKPSSSTTESASMGPVSTLTLLGVLALGALPVVSAIASSFQEGISSVLPVGGCAVERCSLNLLYQRGYCLELHNSPFLVTTF